LISETAQIFEDSSADLPIEHIGEYQRRGDGGVGFDDKPGCVFSQLAPCDFFVWNGAGVRPVACGGIADLAEVRPEGGIDFEVVLEQRNDADWEIAGDAASDLEHAEAAVLCDCAVMVNQPCHVFDAGTDGVDVFDEAACTGGCVHITDC